MTTAPWLVPPDFIGAANAGAHIGLTQQEMQRQAEQHAAELALRADELAARTGQANAERAQQQNQFEAGNALRDAAQKNSFLLGQERNQNQANAIQNLGEYNMSRSALDEAKAKALERGDWLNAVNGNLRTTALQNLPDLMSAHPELTKTEILSRFPMLKANDVPNPVKPVVEKPAPAFPADVQSQLFKQLLANSQGGTNVDQAISGLHRFMSPTAQDDTQAADALQAPTAAPTTLPNPTASSPLPLPNSKSELVPGEIYNTSRGPATWDGSQFTQ